MIFKIISLLEFYIITLIYSIKYILNTNELLNLSYVFIQKRPKYYEDNNCIYVKSFNEIWPKVIQN